MKQHPALCTRRSAALLLLLGLFAINPERAAAQSYPSRSVTIITPFAAGSVTDTTARQVAQHLPSRTATRC